MALTVADCRGLMIRLDSIMGGIAAGDATRVLRECVEGMQVALALAQVPGTTRIEADALEKYTVAIGWACVRAAESL